MYSDISFRLFDGGMKNSLVILGKSLIEFLKIEMFLFLFSY